MMCLWRREDRRVFFYLFFVLAMIWISACGLLNDRDLIEDEEEDQLDVADQTFHEVEGVVFYMRLAEGGRFPVSIDDSGEAEVSEDFWIAETQVTYQLWYRVKAYAKENGYTFANQGREGSHGPIGEKPLEQMHEPVTSISWYDSIVWCNALSEMKGLSPVYTYNGEIYRDATDSWAGDQVVVEICSGFRLPTCDEWELAARDRRSDDSYGAIEFPVGSGRYWSPGDYASGAKAPYTDIMATRDVAWYAGNSHKTMVVGLKPSQGNGLGLYDMSGNVWEWCFEWYPTYIGSHRVNRGGSWSYNESNLQVGAVNCALSFSVSQSHGFRIVRSDD